jgi:Rod binding domain-containing protein
MKISPLSPPSPQSPENPGQTVDGLKARPRPRTKADADPQVREAAEGLEAMFLNTMMQAMRGTVQENELSLENPATKIYRGMLDQQVATDTARNNSVGLADQIVAYLEQRGYNNTQAPIHGRTKPEAGSPPPSPTNDVAKGSDGKVQEVR